MRRIVRDDRDEESHQKNLNCLAMEDKDMEHAVLIIRELPNTKIKDRIRHEKIDLN